MLRRLRPTSRTFYEESTKVTTQQEEMAQSWVILFKLSFHVSTGLTFYSLTNYREKVHRKLSVRHTLLPLISPPSPWRLTSSRLLRAKRYSVKLRGYFWRNGYCINHHQVGFWVRSKKKIRIFAFQSQLNTKPFVFTMIPLSKAVKSMCAENPSLIWRCYCLSSAHAVPNVSNTPHRA